MDGDRWPRMERGLVCVARLCVRRCGIGSYLIGQYSTGASRGEWRALVAPGNFFFFFQLRDIWPDNGELYGRNGLARLCKGREISIFLWRSDRLVPLSCFLSSLEWYWARARDMLVMMSLSCLLLLVQRHTMPCVSSSNGRQRHTTKDKGTGMMKGERKTKE